MERGRRVVIEGTDGTGKSTIADITAEMLRRNGKHVIRLDEPDSAIDEDGTILVPAARELRKLIKDGSIERTPEANVTLFTAARLANWLQATKPALERGDWVVQARDYTSTEAYQGYAEGYGIENVAYITHQTLGNDYMLPDARVILDFDDNAEEERKRRIQQRGILETPDTFEMRGDDFQQRVRDGYRLIARRDNIPLISSQQEKEVVAREVWAQIMGQVGLSLVFDRFDGTR